MKTHFPFQINENFRGTFIEISREDLFWLLGLLMILIFFFYFMYFGVCASYQFWPSLPCFWHWNPIPLSANSLARGFSRGRWRDTGLERGCSSWFCYWVFASLEEEGQGTPGGTHHQGHGILPWAAYPSTQDVHTLANFSTPWWAKAAPLWTQSGSLLWAVF